MVVRDVRCSPLLLFTKWLYLDLKIMTALSSKFRFRLLHTLLQRRTTRGFTLTELLVAILIASIVVAGLLTLVVDLLQNEQRDSARNETQREMQLAMDFIVQDLREAVYVYNGDRFVQSSSATDPPFTVPPIQNFLPNLAAQDGAQPILVFWKPEAIPYQSGGSTIPLSPTYCATLPTTVQQACNDLQISRRTYSLVAYYQTTAPQTGAWRGRSRIIRYVLRRYNDVRTLTVNPGYVDPYSEPTGIFETWPYNSAGTMLQAQRPSNPSSTAASGGSFQAVLADFVDSPTNNVAGVPAPAPCPAIEPATTPPTNYIRTPNATNGTFGSFYACVRPIPTLDNQDVTLYLRGSAWGKPGYPLSRATSTVGFLPALQTQVLLRGVLQKEVAPTN